MKQTTGSSVRRSPGGAGRFFASVCGILGTVMLIAVIAAALPVTAPRLLGYGIYNVVSGSMEPALPVGSVVYARPDDPAAIRPGEVIVFRGGDSVITHRVVENRTVEREFITRGDANEREDISPVPYGALIGRMTWHFPAVGRLLVLFSSATGKLCVIAFAFCGVCLKLLSARLSARHDTPDSGTGS